MKEIIFGCGESSRQYYKSRGSQEIVAFLDNNTEYNEKKIFGVPVYAPEEIVNLDYDEIIITSPVYCEDMRQQLLILGVNDKKIKLKLIGDHSEAKRIINDMSEYSDFLSEQYEQEWSIWRRKYKKTKLYMLPVETIGEMILRFMAMCTEIEENPDIKYVVIPYLKNYKRISNKYLIELFRRYIYLVDENNIEFWKYILCKHLEDVDTIQAYKYERRNWCQTFLKKSDFSEIFSNKEIVEARQRMKKIGITREFVCLAARTKDYQINTLQSDYDQDYRNMDFEDYEKTIDYLNELGMNTVRIGRELNSAMPRTGLIDYAGGVPDDFMDIHLLAQCRFFISSSGSGITFVASLFSRPVLMINLVPISIGFGGLYYTEYDLFLPQKMLDKKKNRILTFREMILVEQEALISGSSYEKLGIVFIRNTPQEIKMATEEMILRMNGRWVDTELDKVNYEKWQIIYKEMMEVWRKNTKVWTGCGVPYRPAATFLRNNTFLLE